MWVKLLSPILILASTQTAPAKNCHKCTDECAAVAKSESWKSGFELVAGFRWDRELECPTSACPQPTSRQVDPFFLGLQQRFPLNEYFTVQARVDRDVWHEGEFQEAPHWNGAVSLNWAPWR